MSAVLCRFEFAVADHLFTVNEDEFQMRLERFDVCVCVCVCVYVCMFSFAMFISFDVHNKKALRVDQEGCM